MSDAEPWAGYDNDLSAFVEDIDLTGSGTTMNDVENAMIALFAAIFMNIDCKDQSVAAVKNNALLSFWAAQTTPPTELVYSDAGGIVGSKVISEVKAYRVKRTWDMCLSMAALHRKYVVAAINRRHPRLHEPQTGQAFQAFDKDHDSGHVHAADLEEYRVAGRVQSGWEIDDI